MECVVHIGDKVSDLFDPHTQPNQRVAYPELSSPLHRNRGMRHYRRMIDQAFNSAQGLGQGKQLSLLAEAFGRLDVAFANAGFGAARGFLEETPEHWRSLVLTNVYGAALTIRATRDALIEAKGHLLITGSVAGRRALPGSLYSATKHAVTAMAESARQELNDTGVRVTSIEPGMVDTPFFDSPPEIEALHAEDVARAVIFAVSQPSRVDINEILIRPTDQPG